MIEDKTPPMPRGQHRCVRCEQGFDLGAVEPCPRAPDGGEHESPFVHWFKPGRLDGLCAHPTTEGLMCGYHERDDFIHAG